MLHEHTLDDKYKKYIYIYILVYVVNNNNNNNNYIYPGYPHHLRVFQWGPASKLQLFTILIVNI